MSATAATHTDSNHLQDIKTVIGTSHLILQHCVKRKAWMFLQLEIKC